MFSFFKRSSKKSSNAKQQALQQQQNSLKQVLDQRKLSLDDNKKCEAFTDASKNTCTPHTNVADQWDAKNRLPNTKVIVDRACVPSDLEIDQRSSSLPPAVSATQKSSPASSAAPSSPTTYNSLFDIMAKGRNKKNNRQNYSANQKNQKCSKIGDNRDNSVEESVDSSLALAEIPQISIESNKTSETDSVAQELSEGLQCELSKCDSIEENSDENCARNVECINSNAPSTAAESGATTSTEIIVNRSGSTSAEREFRESSESYRSCRRVTFAPSPPRSLGSFDDVCDIEEDDETISDDIFYEANHEPNSLTMGAQPTKQASPEATNKPELTILSTVTSNQRNNQLEEHQPETESANNGVICAKIILSVDTNSLLEQADALENNATNDFTSNGISEISSESEITPNESKESNYSDYSDYVNEVIKENHSNDESCNNDSDSDQTTVKTAVKMSYNEDQVCLPDIVVETKNLEHHNQGHNNSDKEKASQDDKENQKSEMVDELQMKVDELCTKIGNLDQELSMKSWAVERLQSELDSSNKEGECVRSKLKAQVEEMERYKQRSEDILDEDSRRYETLEQQLDEHKSKLQTTQHMVHNLSVQLAQATVELESIRKERDHLLDHCAGQEKFLKDLLDTTIEERRKIEAKWKHDFEHLRDVNCDREEHLMEDCEWKIRQMMKSCKEKLEKSEKDRKEAVENSEAVDQLVKSQAVELKQLRQCEAEVKQLRGLSHDQRESILQMTKRVDILKTDLETVNEKLAREVYNCKEIKSKCNYDLCEKDRQTKNKVEIARGEIAMEWEERLMTEMCRLTNELEQTHLEERQAEIQNLKRETQAETDLISNKFKLKEQELMIQITSLKKELEAKQEYLLEIQTDADNHQVQNRMFLERREREHQCVYEQQMKEHADRIEELQEDFSREKEEIKEKFLTSLNQIKEEFATEITDTTETLNTAHKKRLEEQWKRLILEKEEALQSMESRNRRRIDEAEGKLSGLEMRYQHQLSDLLAEHDHVRNTLGRRDSANATEIETLHRKCRTLTKLFEEMRLRYERREPRPEDLRNIEELKSVVESQERDICFLSDQLRELQLNRQQITQQPQNKNNKGKNRNKGRQNNQTQQQQLQQTLNEQQLAQIQLRLQQNQMKKPIQTNCNVIYEENESEESSVAKEDTPEDEQPEMQKDFDSTNFEASTSPEREDIKLILEQPNPLTLDNLNLD